MSYYRTCPYCGSALDLCEICDCQDKKEAAQGATNTQSGKAEQKVSETQCSALSLPKNERECQV